MKFSGVVTDPGTRVEALLDLARYVVAPDVVRDGDFRDRVDVVGVRIWSELDPGVQDLSFSLDAILIPHGQHQSKSGKHEYGVQKRMAVFDPVTAEIIRTEETIDYNVVPDTLRDELWLYDLDFTWDGRRDDGSLVDPESNHFVVATVDYVQLDPETHTISDHSYIGGGMFSSMLTQTDIGWWDSPNPPGLYYVCYGCECFCMSYRDCESMRNICVRDFSHTHISPCHWSGRCKSC